MQPESNTTNMSLSPLIRTAQGYWVIW